MDKKYENKNQSVQGKNKQEEKKGAAKLCPDGKHDESKDCKQKKDSKKM